jgi:hypothetical protein
LRVFETNWKDLFIIGLAQWLVPIHMIDEKELLSTFECSLANRQNSKTILMDSRDALNEFKEIKEAYLKLVNLNLDHSEYEHIKTVSLLRTG